MVYENILQKNRRLTQFLILSIALNVGLMIGFVFKILAPSALSERAGAAVEQGPLVASSERAREVLQRYTHFSFYQLVDELSNKENVEHGFKKRDFALSCLVDFHYLDLDRSLPAIQIQKRKMLLAVPDNKAKKTEIRLFPGLEDTHFAAIIHFIKNEKWPITGEGLFAELKKGGAKEESLYEAFSQLDELRILFNLFERFHCSMTTKELIDMVCEGEWSFIERFYLSQMRSLDLSMPVFEGVLRYYFSTRSSELAHKIVEWGREDWIKRMEDSELVRFIQLLKKPSPQIEAFLRQMLISIRSDEVRKLAALKLFEIRGEKAPEPFDYLAALHYFHPNFVAPETETKAVAQVSSLRRHTVSPGDSLWAIAKKYNVDIDEIIKLNHLSSRHHLDVGKELLIP